MLSLALWFLLIGLGLGLVLAPVTSAVMGTAPPGEEGGVSGVLATTRQVGGVLGIAILGGVLASPSAAELASPGFIPTLNSAPRVATAVTGLGALACLVLPATPGDRGTAAVAG